MARNQDDPKSCKILIILMGNTWSDKLEKEKGMGKEKAFLVVSSVLSK